MSSPRRCHVICFSMNITIMSDKMETLLSIKLSSLRLLWISGFLSLTVKIMFIQEIINNIRQVLAQVWYIIDIFMVHQFHSNVTSDHQPKISNHLIIWFLIGYLRQLFCKLHYRNLKDFPFQWHLSDQKVILLISLHQQGFKNVFTSQTSGPS